MERPTHDKFVWLTPDHLFAWSTLGVEVDDVLREHIDITGSMELMVQHLSRPSITLTLDQVAELGRFLMQLAPAEVASFRSIVHELDTPSARHVDQQLLGVWLAKHAEK